MAERNAPHNFEAQTKKVRAATVLLARCRLVQTAQGENWQIVGAVGSGFFVSSDGWLLTAKHVVNPVSNPLQNGEGIMAFIKVSETTAHYTIARQINHDFAALDVCAIKFERAFGSVPLAERVPVQGEEIGIFGYPSSDLSFTNGQFNANTVTPRVAKTVVGSIERCTKVFDVGTPSAFTITDKIFIESQFVFVKGNSGGPVFSTRDGKIVGIVTGSAHIPQAVQNVQFQALGSATTRNIEAVPFASYSFAISISEVSAVLPKGIYSHWWRGR